MPMIFDRIVTPFSRSSGLPVMLSSVKPPSPNLTCTRPAWDSIEFTRLVLPWSTWAMTATLRIGSAAGRSGCRWRSQRQAVFLALRLQADDAVRPDNRAVLGVRVEVQTVAGSQLERFVLTRQDETDTAPNAVQHLVVGVAVGRIGVVRAVVPAV